MTRFVTRTRVSPFFATCRYLRFTLRFCHTPRTLPTFLPLLPAFPLPRFWFTRFYAFLYVLVHGWFTGYTLHTFFLVTSLHGYLRLFPWFCCTVAVAFTPFHTLPFPVDWLHLYRVLHTVTFVPVLHTGYPTTRLVTCGLHRLHTTHCTTVVAFVLPLRHTVALHTFPTLLRSTFPAVRLLYTYHLFLGLRLPFDSTFTFTFVGYLVYCGSYQFGLRYTRSVTVWLRLHTFFTVDSVTHFTFRYAHARLLLLHHTFTFVRTHVYALRCGLLYRYAFCTLRYLPAVTGLHFTTGCWLRYFACVLRVPVAVPCHHHRVHGYAFRLDYVLDYHAHLYVLLHTRYLLPFCVCTLVTVTAAHRSFGYAHVCCRFTGWLRLLLITVHAHRCYLRLLRSFTPLRYRLRTRGSPLQFCYGFTVTWISLDLLPVHSAHARCYTTVTVYGLSTACLFLRLVVPFAVAFAVATRLRLHTFGLPLFWILLPGLRVTFTLRLWLRSFPTPGYTHVYSLRWTGLLLTLHRVPHI